MHETSAAHDITAARGGDQAAFARLIEPYRHELIVHAYRMLGSLEEAEETVQETFLRAWRRLGTFEGRAPFRAWLYKIATNAALDAREGRGMRSLFATSRPAEPGDPLPAAQLEPVWLEPLPDAFLPEAEAAAEFADPAALTEGRESVALAFLAALQHLPARQRAVLILREVLAWRAEEVADVLDMTVAAVNSALQRARATMSRLPPTYRAETPALAADPRVGRLLRQYVQAWEGANVQRLVTLLHDEAVLTMPPVPAWYRGRAAIAEFLRAHLFAGDAVDRHRLVPTRANGGPALAVYTRGDDGVYRPAALQVLSIADGRIAAIHDFLAFDSRLFARFGLDPAGSR